MKQKVKKYRWIPCIHFYNILQAYLFMDFVIFCKDIFAWQVWPKDQMTITIFWNVI